MFELHILTFSDMIIYLRNCLGQTGFYLAYIQIKFHINTKPSDHNGLATLEVYRAFFSKQLLFFNVFLMGDTTKVRPAFKEDSKNTLQF